MEKFKTPRVLFYITCFCFCFFMIMGILSLIDYAFESIGTFIFVLIFWFIFPTVLLLMMIKISFFDVIINENGVSKYRFNKLLFNISWEELEEIKFYNPPCPWIVFSKQPLDGVGIDKARLFKKTVALIYSKEIGEAVLKYCTNRKILNKINYNLGNAFDQRENDI